MSFPTTIHFFCNGDFFWRVARGTHASGNKLDDVYVKWLLPYDTLSSVEREELLRLGNLWEC